MPTEELEYLDRSHFVSDPSIISQGPATTIAVTPTPLSLVSSTQAPNRSLSPPQKEKKGADEEDEAMETDDPTTTTNTEVEGDSDYRPSTVEIARRHRRRPL